MSWTEDRCETLTTMWRAGRSGSEIAAELGGVTRNAVIGKAHRLGLAGQAARVIRTDRKAQASKAMFKSRRKRAAKPEPKVSIIQRRIFGEAEILPLPQEDTPRGPLVMFADLEANHCRAPYGDPKLPGFGFCGCEKVAGTSYCAEHLRRFHSASQPRPQSTRALNPFLDAAMTTKVREREFVG